MVPFAPCPSLFVLPEQQARRDDCDDVSCSSGEEDIDEQPMQRPALYHQAGLSPAVACSISAAAAAAAAINNRSFWAGLGAQKLQQPLAVDHQVVGSAPSGSWAAFRRAAEDTVRSTEPSVLGSSPAMGSSPMMHGLACSLPTGGLPKGPLAWGKTRPRSGRTANGSVCSMATGIEEEGHSSGGSDASSGGGSTRFRKTRRCSEGGASVTGSLQSSLGRSFMQRHIERHLAQHQQQQQQQDHQQQQQQGVHAMPPATASKPLSRLAGSVGGAASGSTAPSRGAAAASAGNSGARAASERSRRKPAAAAGAESQDMRQLKAYTGKKPVLSTVHKDGVLVYERDTIVTEAHCHLPLPKKFVRQYWPGIVDGGAPQPVQLCIVDDGVVQEGQVPGSIRPQSRKMAISPGIDVLAHHRGWRFCGVAVGPNGSVQLHFDSSTAASYQPAVGRKWAKKYLPSGEEVPVSRQGMQQGRAGGRAAASAAGVEPNAAGGGAAEGSAAYDHAFHGTAVNGSAAHGSAVNGSAVGGSASRVAGGAGISGCDVNGDACELSSSTAPAAGGRGAICAAAGPSGSHHAAHGSTSTASRMGTRSAAAAATAAAAGQGGMASSSLNPAGAHAAAAEAASALAGVPQQPSAAEVAAAAAAIMAAQGHEALVALTAHIKIEEGTATSSVMDLVTMTAAELAAEVAAVAGLPKMEEEEGQELAVFSMAQGIFKAELRLPMQLVHSQLTDLPWDGPPRNVTAHIYVAGRPTGHVFPGYIKKYLNRRKARLMLGYTDFMAKYGGWCVTGVAMGQGASTIQLHVAPAGSSTDHATATAATTATAHAAVAGTAAAGAAAARQGAASSRGGAIANAGQAWSAGGGVVGDSDDGDAFDGMQQASDGDWTPAATAAAAAGRARRSAGRPVAAASRLKGKGAAWDGLEQQQQQSDEDWTPASGSGATKGQRRRGAARASVSGRQQQQVHTGVKHEEDASEPWDGMLMGSDEEWQPVASSVPRGRGSMRVGPGRARQHSSTGSRWRGDGGGDGPEGLEELAVGALQALMQAKHQAA